MKHIFLSTKSKKSEVEAFLKELKLIIESSSFNIDTDFTLIRSRKKGDEEEFSTVYTLLDLDYDAYDVVERIKELTLAEYSETKIDRDDVNPLLLFVFGKDINGRIVYIKLKIKGDHSKYVLCVSFHYAKDKMDFPYA